MSSARCISTAVAVLTILVFICNGWAQTDTPEPQGKPAPFIIERITITGNHKTKDTVIRNKLLFSEGDIYDEEKLTESRFLLITTGFFKDIDFKIRRGTQGRTVAITIIVDERNTIAINDIYIGHSKVTPFWAGVDFGDRNFVGTGLDLSAAMVFGEQQQGYRLRYFDPAVFESILSLQFILLFNNARDFFKGEHGTLVKGKEVDFAELEYRRLGTQTGLGIKLTNFIGLHVRYRFEGIEATFPQAPLMLVPLDVNGEDQSYTRRLDFNIAKGRSYLSALELMFLRNTLDHPVMPSMGSRLCAAVEIGAYVFGSDYEFSKITLAFDKYWELPWNHIISLHAFAGLILGDTPFFNKFFIGDLNDFVPSRVLELNFSSAESPDLLTSTLSRRRYEDIAGKLSLGYAIPFFAGGQNLYKADFFITMGMLSMSSHQDINMFKASDINPFPFDLTMDLGLRFDTSIGVIALSFGTLVTISGM